MRCFDLSQFSTIQDSLRQPCFAQVFERLHGEFKRRVKTQCALPNAEMAAMLFWALKVPPTRATAFAP